MYTHINLNIRSQYMKPLPFSYTKLYTPDPVNNDKIVISNDEITQKIQDQPIIDDPCYTDRPFSYLYWINLFIMIIVGIINMFIVSSKSLKGVLPKIDILYETISNSAFLFFFSIFLAISSSFIWLYILQYHVYLLVWSVIAFIPISCIFLSISCIILISTTNYDTTILCFFLAFDLIIFTIFVKYTKRMSARIQISIEIIQSTCQVLQKNPSIIIASIGLLIFYLFFVFIWLILFLNLLLNGDLDTTDMNHPIFHLYKYSYLIQFYFIFIMVWTTSIFRNIQKYMIAFVVKSWYDNKITSGPSNITMEGIERAASISFGTNVIGGIVLYLTSVARWTVFLLKKTSKRTRTRVSLYHITEFTINCISRFIECFTHFSIYYSAMNNTSFIQSSKAISRLLKSHSVWMIMIDTLSFTVFFVASLIIACLISLIIYNYDVYYLKSIYSFQTSLLFGIFTFYMMQFISGIIIDTMECSFLCYLDNDSNINNDAFEKLISNMKTNDLFSDKVHTVDHNESMPSEHVTLLPLYQQLEPI